MKHANKRVPPRHPHCILSIITARGGRLCLPHILIAIFPLGTFLHLLLLAALGVCRMEWYEHIPYVVNGKDVCVGVLDCGLKRQDGVLLTEYGIHESYAGVYADIQAVMCGRADAPEAYTTWGTFVVCDTFLDAILQVARVVDNISNTDFICLPNDALFPMTAMRGLTISLGAIHDHIPPPEQGFFHLGCSGETRQCLQAAYKLHAAGVEKVYLVLQLLPCKLLYIPRFEEMMEWTRVAKEAIEGGDVLSKWCSVALSDPDNYRRHLEGGDSTFMPQIEDIFARMTMQEPSTKEDGGEREPP